jgi:hypothetical protein
LPDWVSVDFAHATATGWKLYVTDSFGKIHSVDLTEVESSGVIVLINDGAADFARVLAGLWTQLMGAHRYCQSVDGA